MRKWNFVGWVEGNDDVEGMFVVEGEGGVRDWVGWLIRREGWGFKGVECKVGKEFGFYGRFNWVVRGMEDGE